MKTFDMIPNTITEYVHALVAFATWPRFGY